MSLLKKGDTVAFISPSCDKKRKELTQAIKYFKSIGLNPVITDYVGKHKPHDIKYDKLRAEHVNQAFSNSEYKALVCVRGGANSTCILPYLDYELIKQNPKIIIGLSDSTGIQNALFALCKNISLTGYLPAYKLEDNNTLSYTGSALQNALFEDKHQIYSGKSLISGQAKGKLIGGNLTAFNYLLGTKYCPDFNGKILLLEDVGEKTYKTNIMLQQLRQQKGFTKLKGIIIGQFSNVPSPDAEDKTLKETIQNFIQDLDIPVIEDFNYGHISNREILPLGKDVTIFSHLRGCWLKW